VASDEAGSDSESITITVIDSEPPGPVVIVVDERILVVDDPSVLPPAVIQVLESITVSDEVTVRPPVQITIVEEVVVRDDPVVRPPLQITIVEEIAVSDAVALSPSVLLRITEVIDVTDAVVVTPETLGRIAGIVWEDADGDAARDPGEAPLGDVTVYLDLDDDGTLDPGEPSTVTGADGTYEFTDLVPGLWVVRQVVPSGYAQTFPTAQDGGEHRIDLAAGAAVTDGPTSAIARSTCRR
jgi:hypothetical protein